MPWRLLADTVVVVHAAFALFAMFGALLALRWRRALWVHAPVVVFIGLVLLFGWICPLTPLENWLRHQGGAEGYDAGFIDHYVMPVLYPTGLTRPIQAAMAALLVAGNAAVYAWALRRSRREPKRS